MALNTNLCFEEEIYLLTVRDFQKMRQADEKITMMTAYDYPSAAQAETAGTDTILVGDSLGNVVLGYDSTTQVTIDDMVHHGKAVRRGAPETFVVVDMPFMSYHVSVEEGIKNATYIFQQTDAQALKLEGASKETVSITNRLTQGGIPVVGHLGLTPQTVNVMGGYRVQGNNETAGQKLLDDAKRLEEAGISLLVLECVPKELAAVITEALTIPTIGIGAGVDCSGQVLVYHDLLQYGSHRLPKFVKSYADFNHAGVEGLKSYVTEVKQKEFPQDSHAYQIKDKQFLPK